MSAGRGAIFDLSKRAKLRVTGADAVRFLNGQLTNDIRKAATDRAIQASILNAKGKMNAHVFVAVEGDGFVLDADEKLRETLPARLERYVIADDVAIEDVTEKFSLFHYLKLPPEIKDGARVVRANRFGIDGFDVWCSAEITRKFSPEFLSETAAEIFRIERGVPRWGAELSDEIIPIEANLEAAAIDYGKGCYIGQETISRMKMSGQSNKRLCGLISVDNIPLAPGLNLTSSSEPGKIVGKITSAACSEALGKFIALGFVKRGSNEIGATLQVAGENIPVRVAALPFI